MQLRHVECLQKLVRLFKTFWCLSPTAHHHVNPDKCVGHQFLDTVDLIGKQLTVIMTVHQLQYRIASALQWYMEMGHERPTLGAIGYQFIRQKVGFQ